MQVRILKFGLSSEKLKPWRIVKERVQTQTLQPDRHLPMSPDSIRLRQRGDSIKVELTTATQRLSAARLGENLERGQHSERLQVLEQPTLPQKPVSPIGQKYS